MKLRRVSAKMFFVLPCALLIPACGGMPLDPADDSSPIGEQQGKYISLSDPDEEENGGGSSGGGSSSGPTPLGVTFEACFNVARRNEMQAALQDLLGHWTAFENHLADRGLTGPHNCMYDRLTRNGKVQCDACDVAGHSVPWEQTAYICRDWAIGIEADYPSSANSRKVCWASVIMHELKHTCEGIEAGPELVDDAARETLNAVYGLSIDFDGECNQDP